jgi:hypothetical protein
MFTHLERFATLLVQTLPPERAREGSQRKQKNAKSPSEPSKINGEFCPKDRLSSTDTIIEIRVRIRSNGAKDEKYIHYRFYSRNEPANGARRAELLPV